MHGVSFPSLVCAQFFFNQLAICKCELGFELGENREQIQISVREEEISVRELGASGLQAIRPR